MSHIHRWTYRGIVQTQEYPVNNEVAETFIKHYEVIFTCGCGESMLSTPVMKDRIDEDE